MTSKKVEGLEYTRLTKLAIQFWLIKGPIDENILYGVKKYKFDWVRTQ
jgi:expansin (peptidoglycan-binding protein)